MKREISVRRYAFGARNVVRRRGLAMRMSRELRVPPASAFAAFGSGTVVVPPARVQAPECISLGDGVLVLENSWLAVSPLPGQAAPELTIGAGTRIGRSVHVACIGEVRIGDEVLVADNVFITDSHHRFDDAAVPIGRQAMAEARPVVIERGAFIGFRAVILEGVTIGENAYVAAGTVVVEDVPARSVVVGNPARMVRTYDPELGSWRRV
jgi:acetyltransferase-like isoleucine patch superfamily enzyme